MWAIHFHKQFVYKLKINDQNRMKYWWELGHYDSSHNFAENWRGWNGSLKRCRLCVHRNVGYVGVQTYLNVCLCTKCPTKCSFVASGNGEYCLCVPVTKLSRCWVRFWYVNTMTLSSTIFSFANTYFMKLFKSRDSILHYWPNAFLINGFHRQKSEF